LNITVGQGIIDQYMTEFSYSARCYSGLSAWTTVTLFICQPNVQLT